MPQCLVRAVMITLILAVSLEAGTKQATPPLTVTPIEALTAEVRSLDPKGLIVQEVRYVGTMNVAEIVVTAAFDRATDENRRDLINWLRLAWARVNPPSRGMVVLVTQDGRIVGRGSESGDVWIQR
jgi:hypothetical protein